MQVDIIKPKIVYPKRNQLYETPDLINMPYSDFEMVIKGEKKKRNKGMKKEDVLSIYNSNDSYKDLAELFNVSKDVIGKIKRRESYKKFTHDNRAL